MFVLLNQGYMALRGGSVSLRRERLQGEFAGYFQIPLLLFFFHILYLILYLVSPEYIFMKIIIQ